MKDFYKEELIKRKNTRKTQFLILSLLVLAAISLTLIGVSLLFAFVPFCLVLVIIFIYKVSDVEYEYTYFNGNFDVDKIMSKEYRKHLVSVAFEEVEVVAPTGSLEVQQYRKSKKYNYSSHKKGHKTYQMVVNHKGKRVRIVFEPTEELLEAMKITAPRKVFI